MRTSCNSVAGHTDCDLLEKVPIVVGSKIIDRVMGMMTKGELVRATVTWKQLSHIDSKGNGEVRRRSLPPQTLTLQCPGGSA